MGSSDKRRQRGAYLYLAALAVAEEIACTEKQAAAERIGRNDRAGYHWHQAREARARVRFYAANAQEVLL
jgi:hypothetical protein